jgi:hypothetical protein
MNAPQSTDLESLPEDLRDAAKVRERGTMLNMLMEQRDAAYAERNQCVALIARLVMKMGGFAGVTKTAIEGWEPEWHNCIYINLPTGQVSWHFHDREAHFFTGIPRINTIWDGHDTPEKYRRVNTAWE